MITIVRARELAIVAALAGCDRLFAVNELDVPDAGSGARDGTSATFPLCPDDEIVAHWDFDQPTAGVIDRRSQFPGMVFGSLSATPGTHGGAAQFDGASAVVIADHPDLDLAVGSLELWVRFDSRTRMQALSRDATGPGPGHLRIRRGHDTSADGHIYLRFQNPSAQVELVGGFVADRAWTRVVVNFGCMTNLCRLELHAGGSIDAREGTDYSFVANDRPLVFGQDTMNASGTSIGSPQEPLEGAIDEVVLCRHWISP